MYHRYFGLKEAPFSIAVNPRYLFMSARHRDALAHLLYGVGVGGGFILLTGEVGTGKTTVNRCLLEQLPDNIDIALILNPALNAVELLATACDELGIEYDPGEQSLKVLTDKLHQFLLANHANGRNTVLLIDEAQHLQFEVLEQVRLLTNLETNTKKLLQIIFVGQPELRTLLNKPELRQLAQRITARYQLKPLSLEETQAYIRHRLQVAGLPANQELFPKNVIKGLHKVSRGVPRIINVLCDRMLLGTYGQNKTVVDRTILKQAITEVIGDEDDIKLDQPIKKAPFVAAASAVVIAALLWWQWPVISSTLNVAQESKPIVQNTEPKKEQPIKPALVTNEAPSKPAPQPWISTEHQAIGELVEQLSLGAIDVNSICKTPKIDNTRCERLTVKTWQAFMEYNRPAVLSLITPSKMQTYAVVLAIKNNQALLSHHGSISTVPLSTLGQVWTGEFIFLWKASEHYTKPFSQDHSGPMIQWLAQQFSRLDEQPTPLADQVFNAALLERIKIFQRNHALQDDGVVGLKTLLKLNEQLGIEITLDGSTFADSTASISTNNKKG